MPCQVLLTQFWALSTLLKYIYMVNSVLSAPETRTRVEGLREGL